MNKSDLRNFYRPVIIFFILMNGLCLSCGKWLDNFGIDHIVLMYANLILFFLTLVACFIHVQSLKNSNPYAFVRSITLASFMKLIIIAGSVAVYFVTSQNKSIYAVIAAMFIYIIYTVLEVKGAMIANRKKNA